MKSTCLWTAPSDTWWVGSKTCLTWYRSFCFTSTAPIVLESLVSMGKRFGHCSRSSQSLFGSNSSGSSDRKNSSHIWFDHLSKQLTTSRRSLSFWLSRALDSRMLSCPIRARWRMGAFWTTITRQLGFRGCFCSVKTIKLKMSTFTATFCTFLPA